jgi:hypothetical protein
MRALQLLIAAFDLTACASPGTAAAPEWPRGPVDAPLSLTRKGEAMKALVVVILAATLAACATGGTSPALVTETAPTAASAAAAETATAAGTAQDSAPLDADDPDEKSFWASSEYAPQDASESWDDLICKRAGATGSRQVSRRCHTRWEWAQMEAAATETMRDILSIPRPARD